MASRMERYHKDDEKRTSRSTRNKNLYNTMYSYGRYSNIEGIASMDNTNEVDITKVKEMLESKEKYDKERQYRRLSRDVDEGLPMTRRRYEEDTTRCHDVNDVLKSARENMEPDNKERVLNNTNYDILKKLNLKPKSETDDEKKEDLKELIETIASTSMLNKNSDDDINMLEDLVSDDTKAVDVKNIRDFMDKSENTMDNSFFTHSLKIKKADFVGSEKKRSVFKTIFITLLVLAVIAGVVVLVLYNLNFF